MAESSTVAFGRYLRQLRERRGLSISRVCEISRSSPEPFDKGTLSRLERGQQTPLMFRLGPLTRIYEIPAEALLERMELDREVDRTGGPETCGKDFDTLCRAGGEAIARSNKWDAYAYFRDALVVGEAGGSLSAWINLTTAIRSLGKNALALHELDAIEASGKPDGAQLAAIHERMSNCCRCLGEMRRAEAYADSAMAEARQLGDARMLAHACATRGSAAIDQEQWTVANGFIMEGLAAYRDCAGNDSRIVASPSFEAQSTLMLAECSLGMENRTRAQRLVMAAKRLSDEHDLPVSQACAELLLGCIDESAGRVKSALAHWRRAATLAARVESPRIAFAAEVELFRQAMLAGDAPVAAGSRRRLERLAPWIPRHIPAYRRFKDLLHDDRPRAVRAREGEPHVQLPKATVGRAASVDRIDSSGRGHDRRPHAAGRVRSPSTDPW